MKDPRYFLSRVGARLGNWNDRHSSHDSRHGASLRWRTIDRIAGRLYVLGDDADARARGDRS